MDSLQFSSVAEAVKAGQMVRWLTVGEAVKDFPEQWYPGSPLVRFFPQITRYEDLSDSLPEGVDGIVDWLCEHRFNRIEPMVFLDKDGQLAFTRPIYTEAPGGVTMPYGIDKDTGEVFLGIIYEARPASNLHPDIVGTQPPFGPDEDGVNQYEKWQEPQRFQSPVVFAQFPAGFTDFKLGEHTFESLKEGARREALEEANIGLDIEDLRILGYQQTSPSFTGRWGGILEAEVDLDAVLTAKDNGALGDRSELIYKVDYLSLNELRKRIAGEVHEEEIGDELIKVYYRFDALLTAPFGVWMATHPEFASGFAD